MLGFLFKREKANLAAERLQEIYRKLDHLQQTLDKEVQHRKASEVHVHIEYLNLDHPVLESLNFRLDQLGIDELSGTLNLGNNFGTTPGKGGHREEKVKKPPGKTADFSTRTPSNIRKNSSSRGQPKSDQDQFHQTTAGYSYIRKS